MKHSTNKKSPSFSPHFVDRKICSYTINLFPRSICTNVIVNMTKTWPSYFNFLQYNVNKLEILVELLPN